MITELLDSDAVDYDNSDDEDSDQLSIDEITGSVKQRTISVDSYKAEKQDSQPSGVCFVSWLTKALAQCRRATRRVLPWRTRALFEEALSSVNESTDRQSDYLRSRTRKALTRWIYC